MKQFCVFGNPIFHSKSPLIHNAVFSEFGDEIGFSGYYGRYLLQDGMNLRKTFFELGLYGANITIPFKEDAFNQSDENRGIASVVKSVNTLVLEGKKIIGYNTDAEGFYRTISVNGFKSAVLLGAGGSAKAVAHILREKGIELLVLNRSKKRLDSFVSDGFKCSLMEDFSPQPFDIVINATPAGLKDENFPLDEDILKRTLSISKMAYDLIYGVQTPFLKLAQKLGIDFKDGKDMLIEQAVLAFELFCDKKISADKIRKQMKLVL
ncbi:shikimate dehydrogenase [Helicobacter cappadocius]|uniref:Shikimate dehydrogenase (NADP(+)) n=1 Tax=Helicobacter cappadocius TaxID=3063998 RepID=A0AA90T4Z8_9HELI|nr:MULTISPECIES: shikimate dehydrogenase [unclassified Helicobacter]MDO7252855.1 shikimate dehydrogenase [Helicobacter sp. faydin-H75]MDP2538898.1 shikimate dehydrogenase [Helicobacter sp. faydin-H76]